MEIDFSEKSRFSVENKSVRLEFIQFTQDKGAALIQVFHNGLKIGHVTLSAEDVQKLAE